MYSLKNYENIYLSVFMIFQSSMGIGKSRCDILVVAPKDGLAQVY
jgi:hypothetical protein